MQIPKGSDRPARGGEGPDRKDMGMARSAFLLLVAICHSSISESANPSRNMAFLRGPPASFLRLRGNAVSSLRCSTSTAEGKNGIANKVALVALGCPKNTVDAEVRARARFLCKGYRMRLKSDSPCLFCLSQVMLGDLQKRGFSIVRQPAGAILYMRVRR